MVEAPIKINDRLKARNILGKYHTLFTNKKEISRDTPIFINIDEWDSDDEELDNEIEKATDNHRGSSVIVDDYSLENQTMLCYWLIKYGMIKYKLSCVDL
ncbi:hypothetical protein HYE69_05420 [Staphylococcus sp. GSSP0090]|nr:hypothetical protein [Staphylococcus sp. GSSP0090]